MSAAAAYRAGYNRGSADKIAGRKKSRWIPVDHRGAVGEYARGYKDGYASGGRLGDASGALETEVLEAVIVKANSRVDAEIPPRDVTYFFKIAKSAFNGALNTPNMSDDQKKYVAQKIGPTIYNKLRMNGVPSDKLDEVAFMEFGARNAGEIEARKAEIAAERAAPGGIQIPGVSDAPSANPTLLKFKPGLFKGFQPTSPSGGKYDRFQKKTPSGGGPLGGSPPPADTPPPADKPPADKPPADKPPADKPPADKPPADKPPVDKPPVDEPPPMSELRLYSATTTLPARTDAAPTTTAPATETKKEEPEASWISKNWWMLALGGVAIVGAGGFFYYRSKQGK